MRMLLIAACVLATPAFAEQAEKYDRALEQSVMKIVAARMGDLRGGYGAADQPMLITEMRQPEPVVSDGWVDGLAPARERVFVTPALGH